MKAEKISNRFDPTVARARMHDYPAPLLAALPKVAQRLGLELFVVGGTLRDWLLGRTAGDLDLTVAREAVACCHALIAVLGGGAFVLLGRGEEEAGRVVWRGLTIDFSSFRQGAATIVEDLRLRDYTINALGVSLTALLAETAPLSLLDPWHGIDDLANGIVRACPQAFVADPLRMLRGYRLSATLCFTIQADTVREIQSHGELIGRVSWERISHELDLIMNSERAHATISAMTHSGLLWQIIPELAKGLGMVQPGFHHLDVFHHSLAALGYMEEILAAPQRYYPQSATSIQNYIARPGRKGQLKWAALLHDLGKPATMAIRADKGGRITFYNHDQVGREMVLRLGREWKWSNDGREEVAALIGMHMQPFHLCNVRREGPLSRKACLHLSRKAGEDLIGLFLLAMADSLAGKGEQKPPAMEAELAGLLAEILDIQARCIQPVVAGPPLVTGQDLITRFALPPGPLFARILEGLQVARVEGEVVSREEAWRWVERYLAEETEGDDQKE